LSWKRGRSTGVVVHGMNKLEVDSSRLENAYRGKITTSLTLSSSTAGLPKKGASVSL